MNLRSVPTCDRGRNEHNSYLGNSQPKDQQVSQNFCRPWALPACGRLPQALARPPPRPAAMLFWSLLAVGYIMSAESRDDSPLSHIATNQNISRALW